jgi:hypothetical protein
MQIPLARIVESSPLIQIVKCKTMPWSWNLKTIPQLVALASYTMHPRSPPHAPTRTTSNPHPQRRCLLRSCTHPRRRLRSPAPAAFPSPSAARSSPLAAPVELAAGLRLKLWRQVPQSQAPPVLHSADDVGARHLWDGRTTARGATDRKHLQVGPALFGWAPLCWPVLPGFSFSPRALFFWDAAATLQRFPPHGRLLPPPPPPHPSSPPPARRSHSLPLPNPRCQGCSGHGVVPIRRRTAQHPPPRWVSIPSRREHGTLLLMAICLSTVSCFITVQCCVYCS